MAAYSYTTTLPTGVLASNGTTATWSTPNTYFNASSGNPIMTIPHGSNSVEINKNATLDVKGTVRINGMDLEERLKTIERVLCIPERDVILEQKHPKLKQLYDDYINALEKYKTFERLKGENNETTTS